MSFAKFYFFKYSFTSVFFLLSFQDFGDRNSISFVMVHKSLRLVIFFPVSLCCQINFEDCSISNSLIFFLIGTFYSDVESLLGFLFWLLNFQFQNFHLVLHSFNLFAKASSFFIDVNHVYNCFLKHFSGGCLKIFVR